VTQKTEGERDRRRDLADMADGRGPRLLPWSGDGRSCFLVSDGDTESVVSRIADHVEEAQLQIGMELLEQAAKTLADPMTPHVEVRYMAVRLAECLTDAVRVAESRRLRIPLFAAERAEDGPTLPAEAFG